MRTYITRLFAMLLLVLGVGNSVWGDTKTDELTYSLIGVTGTSYAEWTGKTSASSAVYAGKSAGGNSSIQLRSKDSDSGIVTTTSGGKVSSITITWNTATESGRTINVYGKNTAYSSASDLYSSSNGTLLGTIVYGTSTSLTVSGDYQYIGLRSSSGALYVTKIVIEWKTGVDAAEGTINFGDYTTESDGFMTLNAQNDSGTDLNENTWTVTTVGTSSFTQYSNYSQVGSAASSATSITFTMELDSNVKFTRFKAKFGGNSGSSGSVTLKVGDSVVGTGTISSSSTVEVDAGTLSATGKKLTITVTGISNGIRCYYILYEFEEVSPYYYKKVTSASEIGVGEYLIVYERSTTKGNVLDGSLGSSIDSRNNWVEVDISDNSRIPYNATTHNAALTFEKNGETAGDYNLVTIDGLYLTANYKNSRYILDAVNTAYAERVSYSSGTLTILDVYFRDKNLNIYLKYNTSGSRFRFYQSGTSGLADICLYKKTLEEGVEEDDISFLVSQYTMPVGNTYTQKAQTKDASAVVTYSSSDPSVAVVNSTTGEVTALAIGTTTITGTISATGKSATYTIRVAELRDSRYVKVTAAPTGTDKWYTTGKNEYLIVYETAANSKCNVMNGRGSGQDAIMAVQSELTDVDIKYDDDYDVYYIKGNALLDNCTFIMESRGDSIDIKTSYRNRYIGKRSKNVDLGQHNLYPIGHAVTWSSGSPVIKCKYSGSHYTLYYNDKFGYYTSAQQKISLFRKENYHYDSNIYFSNEYVYIAEGATNQEVARHAVGYDGTITYTSLNPEVATVDANGVVTAIKPGQAVIIATGTATKTYYGGSAQYTVMVSAGGEIFTTEYKAIVVEYGGKYYAMKNELTSSAAEPIEVRVVHLEDKDIVVTPYVDDLSWNISISESGSTCTIQNPKTGKYLKPTTSVELELSDSESEGTWEWAELIPSTKEGPRSTYVTGSGSSAKTHYRTFFMQVNTDSGKKTFKNYETNNIQFFQSPTDYSSAPSYYPMRYAYLMYPANGEPQTYVCTNADPKLKGTDDKSTNYVATLKVASVDVERVGSAIPLFQSAKNTIINGVAKELDITDKLDYYAPSTFKAEAAKYNRDVVAGYNTVCLPFAVDMTKNPFREGSEAYVLQSKKVENGTTYITFAKATGTVEAGQPMIVKCPSTVTSWAVSLGDASGIDAVGDPNGNTQASVTLHGEFITVDPVGTGHYKLNSAGTMFVNTTATSTVKPFRFYLDITRDASGAPLRITFSQKGLRGDVNEDNKLTLRDLTMMVDMLNKRREVTERADMNEDGTFDSEDMQGLVDVIIGN